MLGDRATQLLQSFWQSRWGPLLCLLMASALIRIIGQFDFSLDWDEANTLAQAQLPIPELIIANLKRDISLPGMPILLHFWITLFGSSDLAVRLLAYLGGLIGIAASYGLAWELSRSQRTALLCGLFVLLSPIAIHYAHLTTKHGMYFSLVLLSWCCLLRWLRISNRFLLMAYTLTTIVAIHLQPIGPLFFVFQIIYLWRSKQFQKLLSILMILIALSFLPELWALLQPWHPVHLDQIQRSYPIANPLVLLWIYPMLFLFGHENWLPTVPAWQSLIVWFVGTACLIKGWHTLRKSQPQTLFTLLCIAGFPIATLVLISWITHEGASQFRVLLFGMFFIIYLTAHWLTQRFRWWPLVIILALQIFFATEKQLTATEDPYRELSQLIRQNSQPGDGIVIEPGFHYLPFLRYYQPDQFGISQEEQTLAPLQENIYQMLNYQSPNILAFTGDTLQNKVSFLSFQQTHRRIWLFGDWRYQNLLRCGKTYLTLNRDQATRTIAITEHRCLADLTSPQQHPPTNVICHRRLTAPSWECSRMR